MDYIGSLIELITVLIRSLVNDRATKLIKDQKTKETYYKAYDFLKICHNSWSLDFKATTKEEPLLRDYINNFEKNLKRDDHFIYYSDKRRLGSYIIIARRHASLWSKPYSLRSKFNVFSSGPQK